MAASQGYFFTLHVLRSDVWSSFVRMNCNAQFSEIFRTNVFSNLTDIQREIFCRHIFRMDFVVIVREILE